MTTRTCSDCPSPITRQSRTGRCHGCAVRRMHVDPEYQAKRLAGLRRHFDTPGARAAAGARLTAHRAQMSDAERERRREHGRWLIREVLTPERVAKSQTADARARSGLGNIEAKLGWCPVALRGAYRTLIRSKKLSAAEARAIIEAEIPGTVAHARREIASRALASRLRHERDLAEAY